MHTILMLGDGPVPSERRKLLAEAGFSVLEAENPADAIKLAGHHHVDLIVLTAARPGRDGLHTRRQLQISTHTSSIPVVQVFTEISSSQVSDALSQGADAVLVEPVDAAQLLKTITAILSRVDSGW